MKEKKLHINNHVVTSTKKYSLVQTRVLYELTYAIRYEMRYKERNKDDLEMFVPMSEIKKMIGDVSLSNKKARDKIFSKEALRTDVEIMTENYEKKKLIFAFSSIGYDEVKKEMCFKFNKEFIELASDVEKNFSIILMGEFNKLRSTYSQRMYELFIAYNNLPFYKMPIAKFKMFFGIPESFTMGHATQRVLEDSIKEISEVSNGNKIIKFTKQKEDSDGREVSHILFNFIEKEAEGIKKEKEINNKPYFKEIKTPKQSKKDNKCVGASGFNTNGWESINY